MTGPATLRCGTYALDLRVPRIMGILNVTPDSFSDGGRHFGYERALAHARQMRADGADIIDIGGESTRPGAAPVREEEELERIIALITTLSREGFVVSADTMRPAVMRAALAAGASIINDVNALRVPGALEAVAASNAAVCLMHMQGEPRTMQHEPHYDDVVAEVTAFLIDRAELCERAGIARERIILDPGFGFGKLRAHNLALMAALPQLARRGYAVLAGLSRKSMLGELTGRNVDERMSASVAAALAAVAQGAAIVRVHDVRETFDALKVWGALHQSMDK